VILFGVLLSTLLFEEAQANPNISLDPGPAPDLTLIPPVISVQSPENGTVYKTSSVVLAFNVSIPDSSNGFPKWWTSTLQIG
jgi:hypothetical protein